MIRTRFVGDKVEIIKGDINTGFIEVRRKSDGKVLKYHIYELIADGGLEEIIDVLFVLDFKVKHKENG